MPTSIGGFVKVCARVLTVIPSERGKCQLLPDVLQIQINRDCCREISAF